MATMTVILVWGQDVESYKKCTQRTFSYGWASDPVNHKKTHRIYCLEGLNLRRKRP
ncbi:hypothetical protein BSS19_004188, partial [Salmonella enterica subsp. arizonae serovar 41:z4,z32:-]|nr:hypothetical protein [Salmonella enterica subsp. arizonae serovar 41:z4,z32:-]